VVSNTNDSNTGSLRDAVDQANTAGGGSISFAAALTSGGAATITLASPIIVSTSITITGPGSSLLKVSGNNAVRVFTVDNTGGTCQLNISGISIINGHAPDGTAGVPDNQLAGAGGIGENGGGIYNNGGNVTLTNVTMSGNQAGSGGAGGVAVAGGGGGTPSMGGDGGNGGYGGAIYNVLTGTITINNSTFSANTGGIGGIGGGGDIYGSGGSGGSGGAIYNAGNGTISGTITINNSSFSNNYTGFGGNGGNSIAANAGFGGSGGFGGAISNDGVITITNSTFNANYTGNGGSGSYGGSGGSGGAISNDSDSPIIAISNSTFNANYTGNGSIGGNGTSGNGGAGGAIGNNSNDDVVVSGTVTINNSTFNANYTGNGGSGPTPGSSGKGKAIYNYGTLKVGSNIIAGNSTGGDIYHDATTDNNNATAVIASQNYNVIGDGTNDSMIALAGDKVGTTASPLNPNLAALADNGGSTKTQALQSGSPAIGIVASGCPATDQRGINRPVTGCDAGAFELTPGPLTPTTITITSSPNPSVAGQSVTFTATVNPSIATGSATINIHGANASAGITATLKNGVITDTLDPGFLPAGTYTAIATYAGDSTFAGSTSSTLVQTVTAGGSGAYTYYLPFLSNGLNNFSTYPVFQNVGTASTPITITYYDSNGNALASQPSLTGTCNPVPKFGECVLPNPYDATSKGSAIIVSPQQLNVVIPEGTVYGGSDYSIGSGANGSLIVPIALNNYFGGFTTQILVYNGGNAAANATIQFYNSDGTPAVASSTQTVTIQPRTSQSFDQSVASSNLPSGFNGWAQITGNNTNSQTLVAQVLEQNPSSKFVAIANAQSGPNKTVYAPAIFNVAYGAFTTGANIVNPGSSSVTVTVSYYTASGVLNSTTPFSVAAHAVVGVFQGATSGNGIPTGGLPNGYVGAATVTATGAGIVMVVNEAGGLTSTGNARSGTYSAASSGGGSVGLPVIANGAFGGYVTGDTIQNISTGTITGTISYYNLDGTSAGTSQNFTIGANASQAYYQGAAGSGLAAGFFGTAVVTETSGAPNALIVTTNAQSNSLFYTYVEPTQ
jgi:hypothetical protein